MTDARLSRMEDKLDKLSEAIISMARMEERLVSVDKRMDKIATYLRSLMTGWTILRGKQLPEVRR